MGKTVAETGEFGLICRLDKLVAKLGARNEGVTLGIGDDTAAIRPRMGYELLITCDCLVEGRHFLPGKIHPVDLGRRAMAANISDIGAMGGFPLFAIVSLGLRSDLPVQTVEEIYRGFIQELNPFDASIIGGNVTRVEKDFFIDIAMLGEVRKGNLVRRSTAQVGDAILVTGYPGQAAAGLGLLLESPQGEDLSAQPLVQAYLRPNHRARLGQAFALSGNVTAMIDISDGLLADLSHICQKSRKGAELFKKNLPISGDLKRLALRKNMDPAELSTKNSDDYELIITCRPEKKEAVIGTASRIIPVPVTEIGRVTDEAGLLFWIGPEGSRTEIKPRGWDHFDTRGKDHER